jgi:hypothetical protein
MSVRQGAHISIIQREAGLPTLISEPIGNHLKEYVHEERIQNSSELFLQTHKSRRLKQC